MFVLLWIYYPQKWNNGVIISRGGLRYPLPFCVLFNRKGFVLRKEYVHRFPRNPIPIRVASNAVIDSTE